MAPFEIPGNPGSTARLAIGGSAASAIDEGFERDWFRVDLVAGRTYQFDVTGNRAQTGVVDPTLYLRSAGGGFISFDDDGGPGMNSQVTYTPFENGTYFLDVGGSGNSTGGYFISASDKTAGTRSWGNPTADNWAQEQGLTPFTWNNSGWNNSGNISNSSFWYDNSVDNSINNTVDQVFNITVNGSNNVFNNIGNTTYGDFGNTTNTVTEVVTFQDIGTQGNDILSGNQEIAGADYIRGGEGDDEITGFQGADILVGDGGNDLIRGGNGRDALTGGSGQDQLFGGFGQNTFTGDLDGLVDKIYFQSDKYSWNYLLDGTNNQDGNKVDIIGKMDAFDEIYVQGVNDGLLSFGQTTANVKGQDVSGIGIFAGGTLEAIYTGDNLNASQLDAITTGVF